MRQHYWFTWWPAACLVSSHYLSQCWLIVNWTIRKDISVTFQSRCKNLHWSLLWRHNERDSVSNHRRPIVYSTVCWDADQRKHQCSASWPLCGEFTCHRSPVNSPHKGSVTRKMFPFDDVIMKMQMSFAKLRPSDVTVTMIHPIEHDDVIKCKHFPRHRSFVREITGPRWIPSQRPATRSFDVFFDLRLNKRLSEQSICRSFEMPSRSLWRHSNDVELIKLSLKSSFPF